jgi:peptide/nickel transport system substrate-binding protein
MRQGAGLADTSLSRRGFLIAGSAALLTACRSARNYHPVGTATNGGTLTCANFLDAAPANPYQIPGRNVCWLNNVFQPLLFTDARTREPKTVLATSWQVAPDNLSVDITLRDDVTFHTGRKMTAEDVKYSFEQAKLPALGSNFAFVANAFKDITIKSPTQLTVAFDSVQPSLLDYLNWQVIVDKETDAGLKDGSQVIGTGPFMFSEWKPGASFTFKKHERYWAANNVKLDAIEFVVTTDATAELAALRSGRAQVAVGLNTTDTQSFASNLQYQLRLTAGAVHTFGMNVSVPPYDNPVVRRAVAQAIDRERIKQQVFASTGFISDLYWGLDTPGADAGMTERYEFDPDAARKAISDAGAAGSNTPIMYGENPTVRSVYQIVANNIAAVGLVPTPVALDQPTFQTKLIGADVGASYINVFGLGGFGPATLVNSLIPLRKGNPSQFWTQEYEDQRNRLLSATTPDQSATAVHELSNYMLDQEFSVPMIQAPGVVVASAAVHGLEVASHGTLLFETASLSA